MVGPPKLLTIGRSKSLPDLLDTTTKAVGKAAHSFANHYSISAIKGRGGSGSCDFIAIIALNVFWTGAECCQQTAICCLDCLISCLKSNDSNVPRPGPHLDKDH